VEQVIEWARAMQHISWGNQPTVREAEVEQAFNVMAGRVTRVQANFSEFMPLIHAFAAMPAPFCYVGAAEIMLRLSRIDLYTYVPEGLIQALVFAAHAQCVSPLLPDALVTQVAILSAGRHRAWDRLATQTLHLLERVAPHHPRLACARYAYHRSRRDYDQALADCQLAQQQAPTDEERWAAFKGAADTLRDLGRLAEALAAYDVALTHDPHNPWTWHNKSLLLLQLGRPQEALVCNDHALSLAEFGAALSARKRILSESQFRGMQPAQSIKLT